MTRDQAIAKVMDGGRRMTKAEIKTAKERATGLPRRAIVEAVFFFDFTPDEWLDLPPEERQALGGDFTRRWLEGHFPELERKRTGGPNLWFRS
jgi:hypothetical protein